MFRLEPLPRTLEAACRDARHRKESVRLSAVRDLAVLAERGESAASDALRAAVVDDPAPAVRGEAALALADAGAVPAVPELLEAATDAHIRVRQMAVVALGELGPRAEEALRARVAEHLSGLLDAEEPALRYQALIGWTRLAGDEAWVALKRSLADADGEVRHVALRLAEERWLESHELPGDAREACVAALEDSELRVRLAAAVILGRTGDDVGRAVLVEGIAGRTGDPEDVQTAIELVGDLGIREATRALTHRAFGGIPFPSDPFAWQARIALARLGDGRARASILRGLSAWTRETRSLAVVAAGRAALGEARSLIEAMQGDERRAEPSAVEEALEALRGRS